MNNIIFAIIVTFTGGEQPYQTFVMKPSEYACHRSMADFRGSNFDSVFARQARDRGMNVKNIKYECVSQARMEELQDAATEE